METDAKGQLGGLDTSEAERRRYADASRKWKCGVCVQSNCDILTERAEAVKARGNAEAIAQVEQEVPKQLTMKYKDGEAEKVPTPADIHEETQLAEGFVDTTPIPSDPQAFPPPRSLQEVPQSTGITSSDNIQGVAKAGSMQDHHQRFSVRAPHVQPIEEAATEVRRSTDGILIWIDRAIAGVVLCLIFMVLKMLLAISN